MSGPDVRAIDTDTLSELPFPTVRQTFRVHIAEEAFDRATARGAEQPDREIGGILVGRAGRDADGPFVLVETTIDALHAEENSTELTFTHETWAHVHEVMDAEYGDREILGWYHTHPGFGVFLSDRDVFIHRSFFDLPHQIAVVYDPKSRDHGVFTWTDGAPVRSRRYWVGEAEQVWEPGGRGEPRGTKGEASEATTAKTAEPGRQDSQDSQDGPALDRTSFLMAVLVALLFGGLIGWWIGGRGGPSVDPQRQRAALLAAKQEGIQKTVEKLDVHLVELLRRAIDPQAQRQIEGGLEALAKGLAALSAEPTGEAEDATRRRTAIADLEEARRRFTLLRDAQKGVTSILEHVSANKLRIADPRVLRHAAAIGQVCADLAELVAKQGDRDRARRILLLAVAVNPAQRKRYETRIAGLGEEDE